MTGIKIIVEKFINFRINEEANLGKIIIMSTADLNGLQFMPVIDALLLYPLFAVVCTAFI